MPYLFGFFIRNDFPKRPIGSINFILHYLIYVRIFSQDLLSQRPEQDMLVWIIYTFKVTVKRICVVLTRMTE